MSLLEYRKIFERLNCEVPDSGERDGRPYRDIMMPGS